MDVAVCIHCNRLVGAVVEDCLRLFVGHEVSHLPAVHSLKVDEDGVPYYAFPKEGGPFKVSITRQLYCKGISDVSNLVRPSSFDDVWAINFFSSYGTISDKSLTINDYFSEYQEFYEEYSVTFNVKPNPGTKERILGGMSESSKPKRTIPGPFTSHSSSFRPETNHCRLHDSTKKPDNVILVRFLCV